MASLKKSLLFETAFAVYTADVILGEGGAGRVYGATASDGSAVAVKLLAEEGASADKRSRFKNEIAFLSRNRHPNIVEVTDHGLLKSSPVGGPFYVMRRFDSSLRQIMRQPLSPPQVLPMFVQLLDGVEAAHLQGVVHRDLKPENVLFDKRTQTLAVADFGIARFTEDILATLVETGPTQRLANFLYAAPEQRVQGRKAGPPADLYAIGLILNEMFTGEVPHGTDYKTIASVATEFAFLDAIVARLLRQDPAERLQSIADVKLLIEQSRAEAVSHQRLSQISQTVVKATEVDDPLASNPLRIVGVDWVDNTLTLTLDRPVSQDWVDALGNMGNYSSVGGRGPETFRFRSNQATVHAEEHEVQQIVDHFKNWLPAATSVLKQQLEQAALRQEAARRKELQLAKEAEERRLRVLRNIKI